MDKPFANMGAAIGVLVEEKNAAYGDSALRAGQFLKLLYPEGVKPEQYTDVLLVVRILDKLSRIATRKDAFGESPFADIAGYGILGAVSDERASLDARARDIEVRNSLQAERYVSGTAYEPVRTEAERFILGAILLDPDRMDEARWELLRPEHFHVAKHRRIYRCLLNLSASAKAIDMISLSEELGYRALERVGGTAYLSSLSDGLPHDLKIDGSIELLKASTSSRTLRARNRRSKSPKP